MFALKAKQDGKAYLAALAHLVPFISLCFWAIPLLFPLSTWTFGKYNRGNGFFPITFKEFNSGWELVCGLRK